MGLHSPFSCPTCTHRQYPRRCGGEQELFMLLFLMYPTPAFLQPPNQQSWKKCYTTWISVTFWCLEGTWIQDKSAWSSTTVNSTNDTWMPLTLRLATPSMVRSQHSPSAQWCPLRAALSRTTEYGSSCGWHSPRGQVEILMFLHFPF